MRDDWNDERLDDLSDEQRTQGQAIEYLGKQVVMLEERLKGMKEAQDRGVNNKQWWWMLAATALGSPLTALITYLVTKGK